MASSFTTWNSSTGIPSPPLALLIVMLPMAHLTSHSRIPGCRWVITPLWFSGSWRSFLNSFSVYSCHLILISSASVSPYYFCPLLSPSLDEMFPWSNFLPAAKSRKMISSLSCLSQVSILFTERHSACFPLTVIKCFHSLSALAGKSGWLPCCLPYKSGNFIWKNIFYLFSVSAIEMWKRTKTHKSVSFSFYKICFFKILQSRITSYD